MERVEREVGGGIGMGKTCEPKAFSFQCMTELTTNKKTNKRNKTDIQHDFFSTSPDSLGINPCNKNCSSLFICYL